MVNATQTRPGNVNVNMTDQEWEEFARFQNSQNRQQQYAPPQQQYAPQQQQQQQYAQRPSQQRKAPGGGAFRKGLTGSIFGGTVGLGAAVTLAVLTAPLAAAALPVMGIAAAAAGAGALGNIARSRPQHKQTMTGTHRRGFFNSTIGNFMRGGFATALLSTVVFAAACVLTGGAAFAAAPLFIAGTIGASTAVGSLNAAAGLTRWTAETVRNAVVGTKNAITGRNHGPRNFAPPAQGQGHAQEQGRGRGFNSQNLATPANLETAKDVLRGDTSFKDAFKAVVAGTAVGGLIMAAIEGRSRRQAKQASAGQQQPQPQQQTQGQQQPQSTQGQQGQYVPTPQEQANAKQAMDEARQRYETRAKMVDNTRDTSKKSYSFVATKLAAQPDFMQGLYERHQELSSKPMDPKEAAGARDDLNVKVDSKGRVSIEVSDAQLRNGAQFNRLQYINSTIEQHNEQTSEKIAAFDRELNAYSQMEQRMTQIGDPRAQDISALIQQKQEAKQTYLDQSTEALKENIEIAATLPLDQFEGKAPVPPQQRQAKKQQAKQQQAQPQQSNGHYSGSHTPPPPTPPPPPNGNRQRQGQTV